MNSNEDSQIPRSQRSFIRSEFSDLDFNESQNVIQNQPLYRNGLSIINVDQTHVKTNYKERKYNQMTPNEKQEQNRILLRGGPLDQDSIIKMIGNLRQPLSSNHPEPIYHEAEQTENQMTNQHKKMHKKKDKYKKSLSKSKFIQQWTRPQLLKYFCFIQHHKDLYERKKREIVKECWEYLGLMTKQSFRQKNKALGKYHITIGRIIEHLSKVYKFTEEEIQKQKQILNQFLEKKKAQLHQLLNQPFEFQEFQQNLNLEPIKQVCRIVLNQTIIDSRSLSYKILNVDGEIFKDHTQKSKKFFVLLNAAFNLKETEWESMTSQIIEESSQLEDNQNSGLRQNKNITKKNNQIKDNEIFIEHHEIELASDNANNNEINTLSRKELIQSQSDSQFSESQVEPQERIKYDISKDFGKESKQLLDLNHMLSLSPEQIKSLELQSESRILQFKIMRKSINLSEIGTEDKEFLNDGQKWTQDQVLRMVAFMALNQKHFSRLHQIQEYLIYLMVQFIKSKSLKSAQSKFYLQSICVHGLQEFLQKMFVDYKLTKQEFQVQLKRQYTKYLNTSKSIALQGDKVQTIYFPSNGEKKDLIQQIYQKILQNPVEINCVTLEKSDQDENRNTFILNLLKQLKEEFKITKNLTLPFLKVLYDRLIETKRYNMTFQFFKNLIKLKENKLLKNYEKPNKLKLGKNSTKVLKFIKSLNKKDEFCLKVIVQFKINNTIIESHKTRAQKIQNN